MIISFQHKGLELFWQKGSRKGINPQHARKLLFILSLLDNLQSQDELAAYPTLSFHALKGDLKEYYSVVVNGNWRVIFRFNGANVELIDYLDYH